MRAEVWKSAALDRGETPWHFCLPTAVPCETSYFTTWREALDAACAELRKQAES